jgi:plasmid stabilization system protein ParE
LLDLIILERAVDDLFETIRYGCDNYGLAKAEAYVAAIKARIEWLREFPGAGPIHERLRGNVRSFREGRHHIYYTTHAGRMTVIRILHVSRDSARHIV